MTITFLSHSPAEMFLDREDELVVEKQSRLYRINRRTMKACCNKLETFYPLLIGRLGGREDSVISPEQWLLLCNSIIHICLVFLIDLEIVKQVSRKYKLVDDIGLMNALYPQTQEDLIQSLPFSRLLRQQTLSLALNLTRDRMVRINKSPKLLNIYSIKNLKYYIAKKIHATRIDFSLSSNRPTIAMVGINNLYKFIDAKLKKKYDFVNLDLIANSFYSFPGLPNLSLRELLRQELESVLQDIDFPGAKMLAQLMVTLLPVQEVEKFKNNEKKAKEILNKIGPRLMLTSTGHHDAVSSLFLGQSAKRNINLITLQHGSGYCEYASMQTERAIETLLYPSTYLSWGNGLKTPLGSPYLNSLKRRRFKFNKIKRVLVPLEPIYFYQIFDGFIPSQPGFIQDNYRIVIRVLEKIHEKYPNIRFIFKVKTGHARQNNVRAYLSRGLLSKVIFTAKGKTSDYFDNETLVFVPTLSGAFHESLMAEIPFLLYLPENQMYFKEKVNVFLKVLKENFLCGSTVEELVEAMEQQINHQLDYHSLQSHIQKYQEFACLRNARWNDQFAKILEKSLKHVAA